jgi:hypothetical protein
MTMTGGGSELLSARSADRHFCGYFRCRGHNRRLVDALLQSEESLQPGLS